MPGGTRGNRDQSARERIDTERRLNQTLREVDRSIKGLKTSVDQSSRGVTRSSLAQGGEGGLGGGGGVGGDGSRKENRSILFGRGVKGIASQGVSQLGLGSFRAGAARGGLVGSAITAAIEVQKVNSAVTKDLSALGATASERGLDASTTLANRLTVGLFEGNIQRRLNESGALSARQTVRDARSELESQVRGAYAQGVELSDQELAFRAERIIQRETQINDTVLNRVPKAIENAKNNPLRPLLENGQTGLLGDQTLGVSRGLREFAEAVDEARVATERRNRGISDPGSTRGE